MSEKPSYTITPDILSRNLRQRRINRVRTIHGTLTLAGNSLTEQQISDILEETWPSSATDQEGDQVTDQVAKLLAALKESPKTATELMTELGLSHRPTFRKNYLRPAMDAGLVEMTRPESPTAKNQKYRLVVDGWKT